MSGRRRVSVVTMRRMNREPRHGRDEYRHQRRHPPAPGSGRFGNLTLTRLTRVQAA